MYSIRKVAETDLIERKNYGYSQSLIRNCGIDNSLLGAMSDIQAEEWLKSVKNHPNKWIIDADRMIGTVSIRINEVDKKCKLAIEIYDENMCGKGIGSSVVYYILDYVFNDLKLNKVYLRVLEHNVRAIKCYERLGFREEGRDRLGSYINGEYQTDIYMGILKEEFTYGSSRPSLNFEFTK